MTLQRFERADPDLVDLLSTVMADLAAKHDTRQDLQPAWDVLDDLGLTALSPGPDGSEQGTWYDVVAVLRTAAFHGVFAPLAEHDLLANWLRGVAGLPARQGVSIATLRHAHPWSVTWGREASYVVVLEQDGDEVSVSELEGSSLESEESRNLAGEPRSTVVSAGEPLARTTVDPGTLEELVRRGALARAAQACGALERAAELSVAHTTDREQFGRRLTKFQAVQHMLADVAAEVALAKAAVATATAAVTDSGWQSDHAGFAVAVAKSTVGAATETVVRNAHQLHGAIGTTQEHALHRYTNAALAWRSDFGTVADWEDRLAAHILTSDRSLWSLIAG